MNINSSNNSNNVSRAAQNVNQRENQRNSQQLSSGKRINSAADDAAGLGIAIKLNAREQGFNQGTRNTLDMQSLVRTAEGALSGVTDNLQRLNELSLQASNGILTDSDRANIQTEINQILDNIDSISRNTEFNTRPLLDGSAQDLNTASSPDGTGTSVSIPSMSVRDLGLDGFDVSSGNFDMSRITDALNSVSNVRSTLGAKDNGFDFTVANNNIASENHASARSRVEDSDIALAKMQQEQNQMLQEYQLQMQRRQQEQQAQQANRQTEEQNRANSTSRMLNM